MPTVDDFRELLAQKNALDARVDELEAEVSRLVTQQQDLTKRGVNMQAQMRRWRRARTPATAESLPSELEVLVLRQFVADVYGGFTFRAKNYYARRMRQLDAVAVIHRQWKLALAWRRECATRARIRAWRKRRAARAVGLR